MKDDKINADIRKGENIRKVCNTSEWKEIESMFLRTYNSALSDLIDKESEQARITMKVVDQIYNEITNGLRMADLAREQLMKKHGG